MAAGDYRSCDVCGGKAFYDARLNYDTGKKIDGKWVYSETPYRIAGDEPGAFSVGLDYVGDWAVICTGCSPRFMTRIVERAQSTPSPVDSFNDLA